MCLLPDENYSEDPEQKCSECKYPAGESVSRQYRDKVRESIDKKSYAPPVFCSDCVIPLDGAEHRKWQE